MSKGILRTPEQRFTNLPDFDYDPQWVSVESGDFETVRMAWVESGAIDDPPVLMLHGEPSWSFLYRKMMPVFARSGFRAVAPDLIGFGRSDKPREVADHTYARHTAWVRAFIETLDLKGIRLICQDWGGLIGLRLLAEIPHRFAAVVASNTLLPTGTPPVGEAFLKWQSFAQSVPEFPVGGVLDMGTVTELDPAVLAAYEAPFPEESYKAGARALPSIVPTDPDDPEASRNRAAWKVLAALDVPVLCAFGDSDPITGGAAKYMREGFKGAQGQPHCTIKQAGHFIQEDRGEELALVARDFFLEHGDGR